MSSIKCPSCGLVNFATAPLCKRCQHPFETPEQAATEPAEPASSFTEAQPPPKPQSGSVSDPQPQEIRFQTAVRRDGDLLVITEDSVLPDRCVRCNAPCDRQIKRKLNWNPVYIPAIGLISPLVGLFVLAYRLESMTIHIGLCDKHFNRRIAGLFFGGGLIALGLFMGLVMAFNGDYGLMVCGVISLIIGAFLSVLLTPTVTAKRIEKPFIWIAGVHEDFLDSLPVK